MKMARFAEIALFSLGISACAPQRPTATPPDCQVRPDDPCAFSRVEASHDAIEAKRYEEALEILMSCPHRNLPNLVQLMEHYGPETRRRLAAHAAKIQSTLAPPVVSDDLEALLDILEVLGQSEQVSELYVAYKSAGFSPKRSIVFVGALNQTGHFDAALESEEALEHLFEKALASYHLAKDKSPYEAEALVLRRSALRLALPLAAVGRFEQASAVVLRHDEAVGAHSVTRELAKELCAQLTDPDCVSRILEPPKNDGQ